MRLQFVRRLTLLALGVLGALSCSDTSGPGTSKLTLLLKDNPGDVKAAWVTISEINLQGSGGTIHLRDEDFTVDLCTLKNQLATLLQDVVIPAGTYTQLRFVITDAYIEVENADGSSSFYASSPTYGPLAPNTATGSLQMPSFAQSGLKVILPGNAIMIPDGEDVTLIVDFDVSQSFGHGAGNSGQWVMHPVIKGTSATVTGSIQVTLTSAPNVTIPTDAVFTAAITPASGGDAIHVDLTEANQFQATVKFLAPGDYSVSVTQAVPIANSTITQTTPSPTTVLPGETATAAFVLDITGTGT
jgi:choline dehydrogenase-like flavoprotein